MTLFDPGLQPERTELAWRRTCLALGAGSLAALRLLPHAFGSAWWILCGVLGLVTTGVIWIGARRRSETARTTLLREGDRARLPGAALLAVLAVFGTLVGVLSLAVVVLQTIAADAIAIR